jgi:glycosyltransferase involved in cell wall biosynthesis
MKSITFIVPCKNEEKNIRPTVNEIVNSLLKDQEYEILIINDCSDDNTENVIKEICENNPNIILINNRKNLGYGGSFIKALSYAKKEYVNLIPGDNCFISHELRKMITDIDNFDLIISLPKEINDERPYYRKFASNTFTRIINFLFGYKLEYYNGIPVVKTSVINSINIKSESPLFMAEIVIKILKLGLNYDQRIVYFQERQEGKSAIFNLRTIIKTLKDLIYLRATL